MKFWDKYIFVKPNHPWYGMSDEERMESFQGMTEEEQKVDFRSFKVEVLKALVKAFLKTSVMLFVVWLLCELVKMFGGVGIFG